MTKFELPEKPKKTNTSEDFNNLRKAVDELDKFDYTWKTYANKADRRINAANKYIEELERENQRLIANTRPQQALPVVPKCVAGAIAWDEQMDNSIAKNLKDIFTASDKYLKEAGLWIKNNPEKYIIARNIGYTVEKPQLFYLKNKMTTSYLALDTNTGYYEHWGEEIIPKLLKKQEYKISFTQAEIESMDAGSYEKIEVEE